MRLEHRPGHAHADYVIAARREILARIAVGAPDPALCQPLRHGFYVFARGDEDRGEPIGMLEGFLYGQAFRRLEDAPYAQAGDLSRYGAPSELFHVRSVHVAPEHRGGRQLFPRLTMAVAAICVELGARYFTAGTAADARELLDLYQRIGGQVIGPLQFASYSPQILVVFRTADFVAQPLYAETRRGLALDRALLGRTRQLGPALARDAASARAADDTRRRLAHGR